jgi:hypothetical protein
VTADLLKKEKQSTVGLFVEEYLHPRTKKVGSKLVELLESFEKIDEGGLFYQVLLQELEFLGDKVFLGMRRRNQKIIEEVWKAVGFLERGAVRKVGEEVPLYFNGEYCCFAIIIVGTKFKMTPSGEVYVKHIRKNLLPKGIETLYVLGVQENKGVLDNVCAAISDTSRDTGPENRRLR